MYTDLTIPKWCNTLGGVEIFTKSHCDILFDNWLCWVDETQA